MSKQPRRGLLCFIEKYEARIHIIFAVFWVIMVIPTLLFWSDSVAVVLIYSVYALVGAHIAAYEGAKDDTQIELMITEIRELRQLLEDQTK